MQELEFTYNEYTNFYVIHNFTDNELITIMKNADIGARKYWITSEDAEKGKMYKDDKEFDDSWDAICTLNKNPWNQNFKGCSPKWHSQENYSTNPYWNKETKSYILPDKIEKPKSKMKLVDKMKESQKFAITQQNNSSKKDPNNS